MQHMPKVKSGADFPNYVQELIQLGLIKYDNFVTDGHAEYFGKDNFKINSQVKYATKKIAEESSAEQLKHIISIHQQGQTDYLTFCQQAADAGVEKWTTDTEKMLCIYYDLAGNQLLAEPIPTKKY